MGVSIFQSASACQQDDWLQHQTSSPSHIGSTMSLTTPAGLVDGVVPLDGLDLGVEIGVPVPGAGDLAELVTDSSSSVLSERVCWCRQSTC